MSHDERTESVAKAYRGPGLPYWARILLIAAAWAQFFIVFYSRLPSFIPIFVKLKDRHELPTLTRWFMDFWDLSRASFGLPVFMVFAVLFLLDYMAAHWAGSLRHRKLIYWTWFAAAVLFAILATMVFVLSLLLPVFALDAKVL